MTTRTQARDGRPRPASGRTDDGALRLAGVGRSFGAVEALRDVSLEVPAGEVVAVVGPSGCGKSTLLELVCGLQRPDAGTVQAPRAVLMPQGDQLLPWLGALDNAALALRVGGDARMTRQAARERARPVLAALGLDGFAAVRPAQLSGGMRQRVAFARTLLAGAPVLCLDEPFGALDAITRADAQAWLQDALAAEPRTVLLVTHDVEEAVLLADRIVVLSPRPGRVVADLPVALPHPHAATDPGVVALRAQALERLR
jgi:ABC-type nitrate/sulfonate/bicarbonate transport system ATPase subunit